MASKSTLIGSAGEHYIMSHLLRRGYIAALAPQGVPNSDIIVANINGDKLCTIQVKTRRDIGADGGWHLKSKHESVFSDRLFYCFVDFGKDELSTPSVFIIPSKVVAELITLDHKTWLSTLSKKGQKRKDGPMRRLKPDYSKNLGQESPYKMGWLEKYRDAWRSLELD